jgi:adenylyl-sulfate kinase
VRSGTIIWFFGLSGAGKSTLCLALEAELKQRGKTVSIVDADTMRSGLCSDLGFSDCDRVENARRIAHVARLLSLTTNFVLVAAISPFQHLRDMVRQILPEMIEVFVDAPLSVCEERDPKGLYRRARRGEIPHFTGIDASFDRPIRPDLVCRTHEEPIAGSIARLLNYLIEPPLALGHSGERRPTVAVDFDGVIADYDGWRGADVLGTPRPDVIIALKQLKHEGWKIIVHTTREDTAIKHYLLETGVPYDEINTNSDYKTGAVKPVATVYWDDRALTYSGDATRDIELIRNFRTWNSRR